MFQFRFTLTPDDLAEAVKPVKPPAKSQATGSIAAVLVVVGAVVGYRFYQVVTAINGGNHPAPRVDPLFDAPAEQNLWSTLVPSTVLVLSRLLATKVARMKKRKLNSDPSESLHQSQWVTLLVISPMALLVLPLIPSLAIRWHPTPGTQSFAGFFPLLATAVVFMLGRLVRRHVATKLFNDNPAFERERTVWITDEAYTDNDGVAEQRLTWKYFIRCRETTNLILLISEEVKSHILPKRAMPDPLELAAVKATLGSHILGCDFLPATSAGFPVAPLPVVPL